MSIQTRYIQIKNGLRKATLTVPRRRIGAETGITSEGLGVWLHREDANPSVNNLIAVEEWLVKNGFIEPDTGEIRAAPVVMEVKPFDTNHKPSQLRRVVGRDFEQMGVGL